MSRKPTPSVDFDSWLTGDEQQAAETQPAPTPVKKPKAATKTEKPKVIKTENKKDRIASPVASAAPKAKVKQAAAPPPVEAAVDKIKATFHIDPITAERLDAIQYQLKRATGLRGHAISKSKILDIMMQLAHAEVEEQGSNSRISQQLVSK